MVRLCHIVVAGPLVAYPASLWIRDCQCDHILITRRLRYYILRYETGPTEKVSKKRCDLIEMTSAASARQCPAVARRTCHSAFLDVLKYFDLTDNT